jgi:hypothetical protein
MLNLPSQFSGRKIVKDTDDDDKMNVLKFISTKIKLCTSAF